MPRACKIPKDPAVYAQMIEDLAYGLPQVLIANSLDVSESAISRWKRNKRFASDLAVKKLEILRDPIKHIAENSKLVFLERHPDTRGDWGPPTQKQEVSGTITFKGWGSSNDNDPA